MSTILVEYNPATGAITDKAGTVLATAPIGMSYILVTTKADIVLALVKLGVAPEEIIKLQNAELL